MRRRDPPHWSRTVFVDHGSVYAELLREMIPAAVPQVNGVRKILADAGIGPGARVLDLACGIGRHIVPLGVAGYTVVGCDLSPRFVRDARRWARKEGLSSSQARFYVADYRTLGKRLHDAGEGPFDAALCLFTSTGFHGRDSDRSVFRSVLRLVRPGGVLIFETGDRDSILRRFQEVGVARSSTGLEVHEQRRFDRESSTMHSTWAFYRRGRGGHLLRLFGTEIAVRMYSLHELKELFQEAGWKYRHAYGDLASLEPVSSESRRLVVVLRRPIR
jgi:SAM-dependent methyltransferase